MADNHNWNISTDYRVETHRQGLGARAIVEKALTIAGSICIYTNTSITIEEL